MGATNDARDFGGLLQMNKFWWLNTLYQSVESIQVSIVYAKE